MAACGSGDFNPRILLPHIILSMCNFNLNPDIYFVKRYCNYSIKLIFLYFNINPDIIRQ
jgi:hypothetical protein